MTLTSIPPTAVTPLSAAELEEVWASDIGADEYASLRRRPR